ncbi:MAG: hypothetical protein WC707_02560 [Candidatus Babeliaceae bacterium]
MKQFFCVISILLFSCTLMPFPYRFQRLVRLENDKKTIKHCVDFIYDYHAFTKDSAKRPSKKMVKKGVLKPEEQALLSTGERTLLGALRTLDREAGEPVDLLWEHATFFESIPNIEAQFIDYGGKTFLQELQEGVHWLTFTNSDTYRRKYFSDFMDKTYVNKIVDVIASLDELFGTTSPCSSDSDHPYCRIQKISNKTHRIEIRDYWSAFILHDYKTKIRPLLNTVLPSCQPSCIVRDLVEHLNKFPPYEGFDVERVLLPLRVRLTDFEFLINILSTSKEHSIVYAGGAHCEKVSSRLIDYFEYTLLTDIGSESGSAMSLQLLPRAWNYFVEKPSVSLNRYNKAGNKPFINLVLPDSDIMKEYAAFFTDITTGSDEAVVEKLRTFFKKTDKTFANFIEQPINDSFSLLVLTVIRRLAESTKFLLEHGARVNVRNLSGQTPLFFAGPHPKIVELLLQFGADRSARDDNNVSVLEHFKQSQYTDPKSIILIEQKVATSFEKDLSRLNAELSLLMQSLM